MCLKECLPSWDLGLGITIWLTTRKDLLEPTFFENSSLPRRRSKGFVTRFCPINVCWNEEPLQFVDADQSKAVFLTLGKLVHAIKSIMRDQIAG